VDDHYHHVEHPVEHHGEHHDPALDEAVPDPAEDATHHYKKHAPVHVHDDGHHDAHSGIYALVRGLGLVNGRGQGGKNGQWLVQFDHHLAGFDTAHNSTGTPPTTG
jgi:hypothetical protein